MADENRAGCIAGGCLGAVLMVGAGVFVVGAALEKPIDPDVGLGGPGQGTGAMLVGLLIATAGIGLGVVAVALRKWRQGPKDCPERDQVCRSWPRTGRRAGKAPLAAPPPANPPPPSRSTICAQHGWPAGSRLTG